MPNFNILSPIYSFVDFNLRNNAGYLLSSEYGDLIETDDENIIALEDGDNIHSNLDCEGNICTCLPVVRNDDLKFMFNIITETESIAQDIMESDIEGIELLLLNNNEDEVHSWNDEGLNFERIRTGNKKITYIWKYDLEGLTDMLNPEDLFYLKIKAKVNIDGNDITIERKSNCFILKSSTRYTSVIEYNNEEDYAGFQYCNITDFFFNRVRLNIFLNQAKINEDKAVYRKSDGAIKQTRSLLTKEYRVQTEWYPEEIHDKISVALAHNNINIYTGIYSGGISKSGDYDIDWDDDNFCKATAKFKVNTTPFAIRNNGCSNCEEVGGFVLCSDKSIAWVFVHPTAPTEDHIQYFEATWINVNGPTDMGVKVEISSDLGVTWVNPTEGTLTSENTYTFGMIPFNDFYIRITPQCTTEDFGLQEIFYFSHNYLKTFTANSITNNSFIIDTTFITGISYDLSLDGGLTYSQMGITDESYLVTGLASATTYPIVRRMNNTNGIKQILPPVNVTTL